MVVTSGHVVGVRLQKSSTNPLGCKISHQNKTRRRRRRRRRFVFIYIVDLSKKKRDDKGNQNRWLTIQAELE